MLLATIAHRENAGGTTVVHDVTPAVPAAATARVIDHATARDWNLRIAHSGEFSDERYLSNPKTRCYYCKSHLYTEMSRIVSEIGTLSETRLTLLSGTNADDVKEFRPGLRAADEHDVRHPFLELGITKADIRSVASELGLDFAQIPASPCLASRLYTGTRVTAARLRAVEVGEDVLRRRTGLGVVRCRLNDSMVLVEVPRADRDRLDKGILDGVLKAMRFLEPALCGIGVDERGYRSGRAFELTPVGMGAPNQGCRA